MSNQAATQFLRMTLQILIFIIYRIPIFLLPLFQTDCHLWLGAIKKHSSNYYSHIKKSILMPYDYKICFQILVENDATIPTRHHFETVQFAQTLPKK